jgi:hypothetical protein
MPTPCQPHASPLCQPHASPPLCQPACQPHPSRATHAAPAMPTPCQPHANPMLTPCQHANPMPMSTPCAMRPHSSGVFAGTPGPAPVKREERSTPLLGSAPASRKPPASRKRAVHGYAFAFGTPNFQSPQIADRPNRRPKTSSCVCGCVDSDRTC